ncbi:hypothetical protein BT96DRAFT_254947 [Gymnopus androsaceus JB14]|uniref:F-box domain-containing protein n=1 Tax=Gymnopus androsaceus JB14 TaxID=1447944 RepID=A0A6A4H5L0_9AGAR|nr:hypothetical protein BT96DRAFT_254947 [Gymnopus androsaceus JB14]
MDFNSPRLLLSFPIELLTEIIQLADLDTRSSLCRVSKGLSSLSTPILYRDILLKSSSSVVKCLSTLSTCSSSARYVKMLHIAYNTAQASTEDNIIESVELIKNALACLPNILRLAINPPTNERDAYELAICSTTFDKLDTFIWSSKFTVELLEFLARHHQKLITVGFNFEPLEQIQIHRYSLENVEAIVLPKLVKFYGELHHVRLLGASETLKSVTAQWTGNVEDLVGFEKSIMCLGQAKNLTLGHSARP